MLVHQEIYYEIGDGNEINRFFHETLGNQKFSTWQEANETIHDLMRDFNLPREAFAIAKVKINIERME
jgi:hypothetical protein